MPDNQETKVTEETKVTDYIDFDEHLAAFVHKEPTPDELTEIISFLRHNKSPTYHISVSATAGFAEPEHVPFHSDFLQVFLFSLSIPDHLENMPLKEEICADIGTLIKEAFAGTTMNLHNESGVTTIKTGIEARLFANDILRRHEYYGIQVRDRYRCFNLTLPMERPLSDEELAAVYAIVGTKLPNDVKVEMFEIVDSTTDDDLPFVAKFTTSNITKPEQLHLHALYNLLIELFPEDINFGSLSIDV